MRTRTSGAAAVAAVMVSIGVSGCAAGAEVTAAQAAQAPEVSTTEGAEPSASPSPSVSAEPGPECQPDDYDWAEATGGDYTAGTYVVADDNTGPRTLKPDELNGISVFFCDGKWLVIDPTEDLPEEVRTVVETGEDATTGARQLDVVATKNLEICKVYVPQLGSFAKDPYAAALYVWQTSQEWQDAREPGTQDASGAWWIPTGSPGLYEGRQLAILAEDRTSGDYMLAFPTFEDAVAAARALVTPEHCLNAGTDLPVSVGSKP